ncbi:MAG: hypothetical protein Q9163_003491 [Psora crenata]
MDTLAEQTPLTTTPLFKKRVAKSSHRKRPATPPQASDSESSGYTSVSGNEGQRIKRRKKSTIVTGNSAAAAKLSNATELTASTIAADRSANIEQTNDATKQSNWFDGKDSKALLGSTRQDRPPPAVTEGRGESTYKGASAYQSYVTKNPNAPSKTVGPVKAPTNIRTITVTDFAPDVCKDYKQTGFCGFGDSCKFLHAREDYKQGWELDRDWEIGGGGGGGGKGPKKKKHPPPAEREEDEEEDAMLENIPFACIICKKPYKNPIVTKCGHYFCEACALHRYRKSPSCAACGAGTGGVFNGAKQLRKLLDRKRERARTRRERAIEEGEEVSEEEEIDGEGVQV